jgi:hypothetical protein
MHLCVTKMKTASVLTLTPGADQHEYKIIPFPLVAPKETNVNESFCAHCIGITTNYKKQSWLSLI